MWEGRAIDDEDDELQEARQKVIEANRKIRQRDKEEADAIAAAETNNGEPGVNELAAVDDAATENANPDVELVSDESSLDGKSNSSHYIPSDHPGSYNDRSSNSGSEDEFEVRPTSRQRFDGSSEIPQFTLGMTFASPAEFKAAVCTYAILNGKQLRCVKNDKLRVRYICVGDCKFVIYASNERNDGSFVVKTYYPHHECGRGDNRNKLARSSFIAQHFRTRILTDPGIKIRTLKTLCKTLLKVEVNTSVCRNAKAAVLKEVMGCYVEEFRNLWGYVRELRKSNPGSTIILKTCTNNPEKKNYFDRLYICFDALKRGWLVGCRKIIGVDGCFLKGVCKGILLVAVGRDGNNQMFSIAWAVVAAETSVIWTWFIRVLQHDLHLGNGADLAIVSDMQKGLTRAIANVLSQAEHRHCARHIYHAFNKKWKGQERKLGFWLCSRAHFKEDLKDKLKDLSQLGKGIVEDVLTWPVERWCRAYQRTDIKCDVVDNNMAEAFNGWILDSR
ncbi:uncharacterized protein LOC127805696 [Diospyros lotus]|uniref:uncharacterized protein LOC127805696 n=1 Tax=Diospyros lotus TaxID=55363 RepID=UPI00224E96EF|nr:uncharacterized protein LOC127805696 [Diospyros lotus]